MPTVLRVGPYRFFFYSGDGGESPHVHVERDAAEAKIWLDPVQVERSRGFSSKDVRTIQFLIEEHHETLLGSWNDYFDA